MLNWLIDYDAFVPRYSCGQWSDWLIQINQLSNFSIFLAYIFMSAMLLYLWCVRKARFSRSWIILCFSAFIFLCGITHLCDFISFYVAPYRLFTLIDFLTALISLATAVILPSVVSFLMQLKSYTGLINDLEACNLMKNTLGNIIQQEEKRKLRRQEILKKVLDADYDMSTKASEALGVLLKDYEQ